MTDPETFEIRFKGQIQTSFEKAFGSLGAKYFYGYCDDKAVKTAEIKQIKNVVNYFFVEVDSIGESQTYLRTLKRKAIYKRVDLEKKKGAYVFVYIIKGA